MAPALAFAFDPETVTLSLPKTGGLLGRLGLRRDRRELDRLPPVERTLLLAIADLRALAAEKPAELFEVTADRIRLSHRLAAALDARTAEAIGLPPTVDLALRTDAEGVLGSPSFRLRHEWFKNGQRQTVQRVGAILKTSAGERRLPEWLMDAVAVSEGFEPGRNEAQHWNALARFRQLLDPGVRVADSTPAARVSMTDFLAGLEVRIADRFALSPKDEDDFDVVPFSGPNLAKAGYDEAAGVPEEAGELAGPLLRGFQDRVRARGALSAYRLGPGNFLVVDPAAAPALSVMARMQHAPVPEREAFLRNPRPLIAQAVEAALRSDGRLDGLDPIGEEEAIETAALPLLVETQEYADRVTGIGVFRKPDLQIGPDSGTTWLPEAFAAQLTRALEALAPAEVDALHHRVSDAMVAGAATVPFAELDLPARSEALALIERYRGSDAAPEDESETGRGPSDPLVLETVVNFDALKWVAQVKPRVMTVPDTLPSIVRTPLKDHQRESFAWQVAAWKAGLPGILNADEQGLGKTLQTIAFLAWLKQHAADPRAAHRGPVLVVAPTSLLVNWEQEVAQHTEEPGLGNLIRLYGSGIGARKRAGTSGRDIETGESKLDLAFLREALDEGRAHRSWILTTYTTLVNYQHSLRQIPFSAVVFDEIQALKNPASLRAAAARSVRADFRIGLTGTPIENASVDLWAIMDQLAPGSLDSLPEFRDRYGTPEATNMAELHRRVFAPTPPLPALALRRIKDVVARDLPDKERRLHPRPMPECQAAAYEDAHFKLAQGGLGAALKMLHHMRTVSVHPGLDGAEDDAAFIESSARLSAVFDILESIAERRERALVFVEHRRMQYRLIELARARFGLSRIDLINGDTPITQRQAIVNRFQRQLASEETFDLLVLGPKAAGTGLTLTAATHVIHLSRWWNPAVEEQCNDRVHRLGQNRPVTIHVPMAIHPEYREDSFDCLLNDLMLRKRRLAACRIGILI
ncbi:DEAD/DEAH box helicase [Methylobacterium oryzihabitans]|uniref:DEAD/DEAH box helicase n=1 Tax=Methylobacterium oryzihabitans TaxID=2499852 RepID=A0A437NVF5_9HYPH|nr:DEAD/DEAH box helicase [Methylobacterium oryzihabitans]RVU13993.1 DEAD/DEAH box helicase [Methylobacterium oryzihabitans]